MVGEDVDNIEPERPVETNRQRRLSLTRRRTLASLLSVPALSLQQGARALAGGSTLGSTASDQLPAVQSDGDNSTFEYTLTVTDSNDMEVGSVSFTDSFDITNYGGHIGFGSTGDTREDNDRGIVDHVRFENGDTIEDWEQRDLSDYRRTRDQGGDFEIVGSPTDNGENALRVFSSCCGDRITSKDVLLELESGTTVKVAIRNQTDNSETFAHRTEVSVGTNEGGEGGIRLFLVNPGSERTAGAEIATPNAEERIEFEPELGEFYTFSLNIAQSEGGAEVEFTVSPPAPTVEEEITFDASATTGEVDSYKWAFGDGETAIGQVVTHTYEEAGLYEPTLTVERPSGTDTTTETIDVGVEDDKGDGGVTAAFDYAPREPATSEQVTFDASPSTGPITDINWTFGDGDGDEGTVVTHAFDEPGEYEVTLRVVDRPDEIRPSAAETTTDEAATERGPLSNHDTTVVDSTSATIRVEAGSGGFTISNTEPSTLDTITFDAGTGQQAAGTRWIFGDGNSAVGAEVTHQYEFAGTFPVTATVEGTTYERELVVDPAPIRVREVERDVGGTLLSNLPLTETFEADVTTDQETDTDRVEFEVADEERTVETPEGPPFTVGFPIKEVDPPGDSLRTRAVSTDDALHAHREFVEIESLTPWLDFLINGPLGLTVEETEDGQALLLTYDPLENFQAQIGVEIPEEPLADDNNGNNDEQSFNFNIDFGGSYNPLTQTADVRGGGGVVADLMRAEVDASVFAAGTVTTDLQLTDPRGGVSAEVGVTIPSLGPIPLSIPIPGTNDSIGIEPTITPGIDGEFFFTDDLEFERGELTPGVKIEIETEVGVELPGVPDVSLSITVTGDLDIQFDVGTDDPKPGGEFTLSGTIIAKVPGWPVNPAIGGEIYVIEFGEGVDLAADTVRSGTDYELRPATVGGPNPLPAVPSVDAVGVGGAVTPEIGVTATDPRTVDRLTDREFEDFQPTIAALDGGHVVVWSRQAADKPLEAGHDIVARRFDGTSYGDLTAITDDTTSDTHPAAAANAGGDVLAVWITHDVDLTREEVADLEKFFATTELAYSVHDGSGWSEPTVLTDTDRVQQRPAVAADGDEWVVAWESLDDADDDSAVRVARFGSDSTVTELDVREDAANPDVGHRSDGDVDLAYLAGSGGTVTGVAHERLDGGTTVATETYDAAGATNVVVGDGRLVWLIGQGDPTLEAAEGGTRTELDIREEVTSVAELSLSSSGGDRVLSYRASVTGSPNRDLVYRLDRGDGWIRDRRIAGSPENDLNLWYAESALLGDDSFATVYAAGEPDADAVNDVFVTRQPFAPAYRIEGDVDSATTGEETTVSYSLQNLGDIDGAADVTVTLASEGETVSSRTHNPLAVGEELTDTFTATVDDTGTFELAVDADEPLLAEEQTSVEVVAAEPALRVDGVEAERAEAGALSVTVAVANDGGVPVEDVPVALENPPAQLVPAATQDAGERLALLTIDEVGAESRETARATIDPTALVDDRPQRARIAPDGTIPDELLVRRERRTHLARPDLAVEDVRYRVDDETFVRVVLSNRGPGVGEATLSVTDHDAGTTLKTTDVAVDPGAPDDATFTTVTLDAPGLEVGDTVQTRLDPAIPDLHPSGLARQEIARAILPGSVTDIPPLPGQDAPPQDLDGDGRFEDVNGDGQFTVADVQTFFQHRNSDPVRNNPAAFNFDGDDPAEVSVSDVQALFIDLVRGTEGVSVEDIDVSVREVFDGDPAETLDGALAVLLDSEDDDKDGSARGSALDWGPFGG